MYYYIDSMNVADSSIPPIPPIPKIGTLYLVATPIGNLADMSQRALETLAAADFIAAEDTRVTRKLTARFNIRKPLVSYHQHNQVSAGRAILKRILAGETCALVTDAGTPAISDPGAALAELCAENGVTVQSIPGCCALITALTVSGLDTTRFVFEGFLPAAGKERRERLTALSEEERTVILYEAPHRLRATLADLLAVLGDRPISLCRELTKMHEETIRTTLVQAVAIYQEREPRGEYVLVLAGAERTEKTTTMSLEEGAALVRARHDAGTPWKEAVRQTAAETGLNRNKLYAAALAASDKKTEI